MATPLTSLQSALVLDGVPVVVVGIIRKGLAHPTMPAQVLVIQRSAHSSRILPVGFYYEQLAFNSIGVEGWLITSFTGDGRGAITWNSS